MTSDRETVAAALLAQFKANPGGFVTIGRRHVMPPVLGDEQQPALFITQSMEETKRPNVGIPGVTTMEAVLFVYCGAPGVDEAPGAETLLAETTLNGLLTDIDNAIAPDASGYQTLGGVVRHCWIEGQTFKDPGILGVQAMAIVPVLMLVP